MLSLPGAPGSALLPGCWTHGRGISNLEIAQVGDAGFHEVEVHFDEVVFYAAGFCGGEDFFPVESALSYRNDFFSCGGPALNVHGEKAAGIFHEILGGVEAFADRGNLELEIDEF